MVPATTLVESQEMEPLIYLTMIWIAVFWTFGWLLVFMNGMVPKMTAPWPFIATIPMIITKATVWADTAGGPQIILISLPLNIIGPAFSLAVLFSLIAIWNAFEYMGRDYFGRKRKK